MKKIVAMVLALMMVLSFAGCGKTDNRGKTHEELGYQWEDTKAPIVKAKGLTNFKVLSQKNAMADDFNDMKVFKDLYDATNVDVNWENLSASAYEARKSLIVSDKKNWPDAIHHAYFSDAEMIRYAGRRYFLPISDYLDYMPNFKAILDKRPDVRSMITLQDGKIYSLPRVEEMGLMPYPNLLFMNKVWLKKLIDAGEIDFITEAELKDGLNLTITQMEQVLTLFKSRDMNDNGNANDEIPLSFVYQNWQGNQCDLYGAFGLPENNDHLLAIDDKVTLTAVDDKFKEATNYYAGWVKKGLIDKSSFENGEDKFLASGKGVEKLGAFYWWESETVVANPENYICMNPLMGADGKTQMIGLANNPEISKCLFVVMASCPNPEVLLTYMDRFYDPMISAQIVYGPIGVVYEEELDENGKLVQKPIPDGMTADEFRLKNAPMGVSYLSDETWEKYLNMEPRAQLRLERLAERAIPFAPKNVTALPHLTFTQEEINVLSTVQVNIKDYIASKLTKWLLEGGVSDKDWNEYKTTLVNQIGMNDYLRVYQAAYDRQQADLNK